MAKRLIPAVLALLLILPSCARKEKEEKVATVNDTSILLKDFRKEVSVNSRRDPSLKVTPESLEHILEDIIKRKLMIQEAVKKGLADDERFLETIKTFWEQTLIRHLIEAKTKEWSETIFVNDEEARAHYGKMTRRVTMRTIEVEDKKKAQEARAALERGDFTDAETVGPVMIEDVEVGSPLYVAFDQAEGAVGVYKYGEDLLVVKVVKKEAIKAPPYDEVYPRIKAALLEQKKQKALEDWLTEVRKSAKIEIDKNLLNRMANE